MAVITDLIGAGVSTVDTTPQFNLGQVANGNALDQYLYVKANTALSGAGLVCTIDASHGADALSTSNDARGNIVGVAMAAIAANSYGWLQIRGTCSMSVKASAAANVRLNTTATAGYIDDDGTAGSMQVEGAYLTTARGGTDGTAAARLNYPFVSATL